MFSSLVDDNIRTFFYVSFLHTNANVANFSNSHWKNRFSQRSFGTISSVVVNLNDRTNTTYTRRYAQLLWSLR